MNIVVIGSGYVGLVTGCCLAQAGNSVVCVDRDTRKIAALNAGEPPFFEPELAPLLASQLESGRLSFAVSPAGAAAGADVVFLAVGTPANADGSANLDPLLLCAQELGRMDLGTALVVVKSTVPVGTCDRVEALLNENRGALPALRVASNPEFLAEGRAVHEFQYPDRIVIGVEDAESADVLARLYAPFDHDGGRRMFMDRHSAEFAKYACNAMLAARISMVNELVGLAGRLGADSGAVCEVMKADPRIGENYLAPGVGYGGSCLPKDVSALISAARGMGEPADMLCSAQRVNRRQGALLLAAVRDHFHGSVEGARIAVWGLSFKPGTDDVRAAPSIALIRALIAEGARVAAYDPVAMPAARNAPDMPLVMFGTSALAACMNADALVLMTEWDEFRDADFAAVAGCMRGRMVFDARNLYSAEALSQYGLRHCHLGERLGPSVQAGPDGYGSMASPAAGARPELEADRSYG